MARRTWWSLFKQTVEEWIEDKVPRLGASLAFYSILSLGPLLLLALAGASVIFGPEAAQGRIVAQIDDVVGHDGARAIQDMIASAAKEKEQGIFAAIIGVVTLIFGASGVFGQLQDALNTIWEVKPIPGRGIMGFVRDRFLSITMVFGTGFLLLVSLVINTALTALGDYTSALFSGFTFLAQLLNFVVSFGVITLLFAVIFKYLPDAKIAWRDVWIGAVLTALLFTVGKLGISLYLGHSSIGSSYGAAGSLVVVLVWVYYSSQILFFGAEFTQVYANRHSKDILPTENAKKVTAGERVQHGEEC